jgi:hypothetical protein
MLRAGVAALVLPAGCAPPGPVVRQAEDAQVRVIRGDDVQRTRRAARQGTDTPRFGPALVVSGAADFAEARRAIHVFCGYATAFDPEARGDMMYQVTVNPDATTAIGDFVREGRC